MFKNIVTRKVRKLKAPDVCRNYEKFYYYYVVFNNNKLILNYNGWQGWFPIYNDDGGKFILLDTIIGNFEEKNKIKIYLLFNKN